MGRQRSIRKRKAPPMDLRKRTLFATPAAVAIALATGVSPAAADPPPDTETNCVACAATRGPGDAQRRVAQRFADQQLADERARQRC